MTSPAAISEAKARKRKGIAARYVCMSAIGLVLTMALVAANPSSARDDSYLQVTGPCHLEFPEDHGPHEGFHTEWWYYTGNLQSETGDRYGFQLTFFRNRIVPPGDERSWPDPPSAWRTEQVYLAHAALSDVGRERFEHAERIARGVPGLAGSDLKEGVTTLFLGDWSAVIEPERHLLAAKTDAFALELTLLPLKDPVPHGDSGYSLKGSSAEKASCYYSFTRLKAEGSIAMGKESIPVKGTAWMDHEFSSSPLESDLAGWDWFSLQLSDDTELMIYMLRREDGTYSQASSGTFVDEKGAPTHLSTEQFTVETLGRWKSPHSNAVYPSGWRIRVPSPGIDLTVIPNLRDQELETPGSTRVTYWEGSVRTTGSARNEPVSGVGYVELTGYAGPLNALR